MHGPGIDNGVHTIDVQTGEVKVGGRDAVFLSTAIGSCIAVAALDTEAFLGGIAHIMLPGQAPGNAGWPQTRYAHDGVADLIAELEAMGGTIRNLCVCLAGGANVLRDPHDTICRENVASVLAQCERLGVPVVAQSLGGYQRRRVMLNIGKRQVSCGIGDRADFALWSYDERRTA
jgi:chemotaxis protein CheD